MEVTKILGESPKKSHDRCDHIFERESFYEILNLKTLVPVVIDFFLVAPPRILVTSIFAPRPTFLSFCKLRTPLHVIGVQRALVPVPEPQRTKW